jgi:hypothetical protein
LQTDNVHTLGPVAIGADAASFDEVKTRFLMYVPGEYLSLLIACCMSPKEALLTINTKAVTQNKEDMLAPLINWLRVAVTCLAVDPNVHSPVAHSAMPSMPLMEPELAAKQNIICGR